MLLPEAAAFSIPYHTNLLDRHGINKSVMFLFAWQFARRHSCHVERMQSQKNILKPFSLSRQLNCSIKTHGQNSFSQNPYQSISVGQSATSKSSLAKLHRIHRDCTPTHFTFRDILIRILNEKSSDAPAAPILHLIPEVEPQRR